MKRRKRGTQVLTMLLALVIVLGALPTAALAAEPTLAAESATDQITVYISFQNGSYVIPKQEVKVSADLSDLYGYDDSVTDGLSALDVLIAAHELYYNSALPGADFSTWLKGALSVSYGFATNVFATGSSNFSFAVNGAMPIDKNFTFGTDFMALSISEAAIGEGDYVEFFIFQDDWWLDYYTWFTDIDGSRVSALEAETGQTIELFIKGYSYMWYGSAIDETKRDGSALVYYAEDMPIVLLDRDIGAILETQTAADEDGMFSVIFTEPGVYILSALDNDIFPIFAPWLEITVNAAQEPPGQITYETALKGALDRIRENTAAPAVGSVGGEWAVIALARAGVKDDSWYEAYLAALNEAITNGNYELTKWTDYQRVTLVLTALGLNAADYKGHDMTAMFAAYIPPAQRPVSSLTLNADIFALIALDSKPYNAEQQKYTDSILAAQLTSGAWNLTGSESLPAAVDITAMAVQALAPYYNKNPNVKTSVDKAIAWIGGQTIDDAENIAQIIIAKTALGFDCEDDVRALLKYYDAATGGFTRGGVVDAMATEQAACALVAYSRYKSGSNRLYDMSDTADSGSKPPAPQTVYISVTDPGATGSQKKVYFAEQGFSLNSGETALSLLRRTGLTIITTGSSDNTYVASIDGFGEFSDGPLSGWIYKVNGISPDVSSSRYNLKDGDKVEWVYTRDLGADVGKDPGAGTGPGTGLVPKTDKDEESELQTETEKEKRLWLGAGDRENPFGDVKETDWYYNAVMFVNANGLMIGVSAAEFAPNSNLTRAMLVTILYRIEGSGLLFQGSADKDGREKSESEILNSEFVDVVEGAWYSDAVRWAAENGMVTGYGDGRYGPNDDITREQFVTILYRYSKFAGFDVSVGEDTNILSYEDAFSVSEYAIPAFQWACGAGVITGKPGGYLDPLGKATRAEAATILMRFLVEG